MMATAMPISPARTPRRAVRGMAQPFERQNEQCRGNNVGAPHEDRIRASWSALAGRLGQHAVREQRAIHGCDVSRRNIFSIRSVIQNPPTMLVVAAITASVPRNVLRVELPSAVT